MSVKIISCELENVKKVALVKLEPSEKGLTVIGGGNAQGKTSILDGICYALGGEKYRPSNLQRDGSAADARIRIVLSNKLVVERKGKNASLKVTDPSGVKAGQKLLDSFIDELALNLPKFMAMNNRDKATVLLRTLGIEDQLEKLQKEEQAAYDERHAQGRLADQKEKYAAEMPEHHDVPAEPLTTGELVKESQAVMERNAERANARREIEAAKAELNQKEARVIELKQMVDEAENAEQKARDRVVKALEVEPTPDESTAEVEKKLAELEDTNAKVRQNLDKRKAIEDAEAARNEYDKLTGKVEDVRKRRMELLNSVEMPLPGLSVEDSELVLNGQKWDCMSSAEQYRAATAIVRKLNPACGFVLLDHLESFDLNQLKAFGEWLEAEGLQAIATRVSTGDECSLVIEDGIAKEKTAPAPAAPAAEENETNELDW